MASLFKCDFLELLCSSRQDFRERHAVPTQASCYHFTYTCYVALRPIHLCVTGVYNTIKPIMITTGLRPYTAASFRRVCRSVRDLKCSTGLCVFVIRAVQWHYFMSQHIVNTVGVSREFALNSDEPSRSSIIATTVWNHRLSSFLYTVFQNNTLFDFWS